MLPTSRRLVLGAACAASLLAVPAASHAAGRTYDATATGTVQYVRKDVFPSQGVNSNEYQVTLAFKTVVHDVAFDVNHNLTSTGAVETTVSDVSASDKSTVIVPKVVSKTGGCSSTRGTVVAPGKLGPGLLKPLDGSELVEVRPFEEVDFPMDACWGELGTSHVWPLNPWNEDLGESALDAETQVPAEAFGGDVWTGDLQAARPSAKCPGTLDEFTTLCSVAIAGRLTLQRHTGEPDPDPTPVPSTTPQPTQTPAPPVWQPPAPAQTTRDGKLTHRAQWANGGRKIRVKLTCNAECDGRLTFLMPGGGKAIGKPVTLDLHAGRSKTVVLDVSKAQSKAIDHAHKLSMRFVAAPATATPSTKKAVKVPRRG